MKESKSGNILSIFNILIYLWPIPLFWYVDWYYVIVAYNITFTLLALKFYSSRNFYAKEYSLFKVILYPLILGFVGFIITVVQGINKKKDNSKTDGLETANDTSKPKSKELKTIEKKIYDSDYVDIYEYISQNGIKDIHQLRNSLKNQDFDSLYIKQTFGIRYPILQFTSNDYIDGSFSKSSEEEFSNELEYNSESMFDDKADNGKGFYKKSTLDLLRLVTKKKSEVLIEIDNYIEDDLSDAENKDSINDFTDNYIKDTDLDHWNDWRDSDFLYPPAGIDLELTRVDDLIPASEIFSHISYELIQTYEVSGILLKMK